MKYKLMIVFGILILIFGMYNIYLYQLDVEIPNELETKYEFFYRIGYMQNEGNKFLFPLTLLVPSILLAIGTVGLIEINQNKKGEE